MTDRAELRQLAEAATTACECAHLTASDLPCTSCYDWLAAANPARIIGLCKELEAARARVAELRDCLSPFALFASALKNTKSHWPVLQYEHQRLTAGCFYDAQDQFPELVELHGHLRGAAALAPQGAAQWVSRPSWPNGSALMDAPTGFKGYATTNPHMGPVSLATLDEAIKVLRDARAELEAMRRERDEQRVQLTLCEESNRERREIQLAAQDERNRLAEQVKLLREALLSARDLAMRVGDGKHELSAKASVVYSHASQALAATAPEVTDGR